MDIPYTPVRFSSASIALHWPMAAMLVATALTMELATHTLNTNRAVPWLTIAPDGPPRMVKRPNGSGGEPSSPNCGASAGGKARHLFQSVAYGSACQQLACICDLNTDALLFIPLSSVRWLAMLVLTGSVPMVFAAAPIEVGRPIQAVHRPWQLWWAPVHEACCRKIDQRRQQALRQRSRLRQATREAVSLHPR